MIQIADLGRGLPDEFYAGLYKVHDKEPNGCKVGHLVKDYSMNAAYRLGRFRAASSGGVGLLWQTNRKKFNATTADGGSRGQREITLTVGTSDAVAEDEFARGTILVLTGSGAGRRFYIYANKAKDASHKVVVELDRSIKFDFGETDTVILISHKYMNCVIGETGTATAQAQIEVGASLVASPVNNKFGWFQCGGLGPAISSVAVDGSDSGGTDLQDGTPFIKADNGRLALQGDTNIKRAIASLVKEGDDLTAGGIMPVEWHIPEL